jgi:Putative adhesin
MTQSPSRPPAQELPRLLPRPPHAMRRRSSRAAALALLPALAVAASGCDVLTADLKHSETAKWEKTYQLAEGGRVEIRNVNGKITVEPSTGNTVEVVAVKTARGATGEAARAELGRIEIAEQASSDAVRIETKVARGERWFGGGTQVAYTVRVPAGAETRFVTVNGGVNATGLNGKTTLETTNGGVVARNIGGAIEASTTNGGVDLEVTRVAEGGVKMSCTNGGLSLALPSDAKASIRASVTNGGIDTGGLDLSTTESSRRRLVGTLNGGGPQISIQGTNGGVTLRRR